MSNKAHRLMFLIGAAWNLAIGGANIIDPAGSLSRMLGREVSTSDPSLLLLCRAFGVCVLLFGVGYYLVARDLDRNDGVVIIGIMGKLYVVASMGWGWWSGEVSAAVLPLLAGDLFFAIGFIAFLRQKRIAPT